MLKYSKRKIRCQGPFFPGCTLGPISTSKVLANFGLKYPLLLDYRKMDLQVYLNRIGYSGTVEPTLNCLMAIHRLQAFTIPYENIDIQLGRRLDRDRERIFDKLVSLQRGGWCYETHELLHWALVTIGFDARLVRREFTGVNLAM